jgi:outer membrane protein assembly factor BamB
MYGMKALPINDVSEGSGGISTFNIPGTRDRTLRTYDGNLIIVTAKGAAAITDAGEVKWTYRLPENDRVRDIIKLRGKTRLINGKLVIRGDTYFAVVDASDGTPIWERSVGDTASLSDAAATKNGVYVAMAGRGSVNNTFGTKMLLRMYALETGEKLGQRAFDEDYTLLNSDDGVLLQQTNYDWEFTELTL